jgi:hypothetical protein
VLRYSTVLQASTESTRNDLLGELRYNPQRTLTYRGLDRRSSQIQFNTYFSSVAKMIRNLVTKGKIVGANPANVSNLITRMAIRAVASDSPTTVSPKAMDHRHFKLSNKPHPLKPLKPMDAKAKYDEEVNSGDHTGRLQNHIRTKEEIDNCMSTLYRHEPKTVTDHVTNKLVSFLLSSSHARHHSELTFIVIIRCTVCIIRSTFSLDSSKRILLLNQSNGD